METEATHCSVSGDLIQLQRSDAVKTQVMMLMLSVLCTSTVHADSGRVTQEGDASQTVYRAAPQNAFKGSEEHFTGDVRVERLFPANATAHYSGASVTFQPGARSAWHLHPAGQHMIVTAGVALTGTRDGKIVQFKTGDTVWCPPGLEHWHGATPDAPMTHLVITGVLDGKNVVWKEQVTDEQYKGHQ